MVLVPLADIYTFLISACLLLVALSALTRSVLLALCSPAPSFCLLSSLNRSLCSHSLCSCTLVVLPPGLFNSMPQCLLTHSLLASASRSEDEPAAPSVIPEPISELDTMAALVSTQEMNDPFDDKFEKRPSAAQQAGAKMYAIGKADEPVKTDQRELSESKRSVVQAGSEQNRHSNSMWTNLALSGGGVVGGIPYSKTMCYIQALVVDQEHSSSWCLSHTCCSHCAYNPSGHRLGISPVRLCLHCLPLPASRTFSCVLRLLHCVLVCLAALYCTEV